MRQKLKAVKKEMDDQVRKAQQDLVGIVSNEAKSLVEQVGNEEDYTFIFMKTRVCEKARLEGFRIKEIVVNLLVAVS